MKCKFCGHRAYGELCFRCKPRKPITKKGKEYYKWQEFRGGWFERHPPDIDGNYICYLCDRPVHKDNAVLDHVVPQGWGHKRKYDDSNIQPVHPFCNVRKGSNRVGKGSQKAPSQELGG